MKLVSLSLKNFRQHYSTHLEFKDGITGVIGNNGSGKSTIVEAIGFALYGSKALRGKIKDVRTFGVSETLETSTELVFEHDGENYRVVRNLTEAKLYYAGQADPIASGNKNVVFKIEEILGLNLEEFLASYYTEQKSLEFLSGKKGATEREKFITRMIGYDRLEKMQGLIRDDKRDLKNQVQGLAVGIGEETELKTRLEEQTDLNKSLLVKEKDAAKALESAELQETVAKKEFRELDREYQEYQATRKEQEALAVKIAINQDSQAKLESENKKLSTVIKDKLGSYAETTDLKKSLENLEIKSEQQQSDEKKLNLDIDKLVKKKEEKLTAKNKELAIANNQEQQINTKITTLEKLQTGADCPTCGQVLGDEFKEVAVKLAVELDIIIDSIKQITKDIKSLEKTDARELKLSKTLDELIIEQQKTLDELKILRSTQAEIISLDTNKKTLASLAAEIKVLKKQQQSVAGKVSAKKFDENVYRAAKSKFDSAVSLANVSRMQKVRGEGELQKSAALLERAQADLLDYQQKQAELVARKNDLNILEQADQTLTDFRRYLNQTVKPRLAELASGYLAELSDGRYSNLQITEDFSTEVYEDGFLKKTLSGGEEDMLDLCLRLALSSLIAERAGHNLSFLILDEVFGSLDENRRFNVLNLLEKLRNRFEQILLITHLDDIKDSVSNLIYIDYDEANSELSINSDIGQVIEANL